MSAAAVDAPSPAARANIRVIFAGLMLVLLLAALDQTIVATALPTIVSDLGGLSHLSWITSAFLLAQTVVTPIYGKLGDLYGRKRILQSAIVLFLIGSALAGQAHSMTELIAFRAVQGLGAGGLVVLIQAVIGDVVPPRQRGATRACSVLSSGSRASAARCSAGSLSSPCHGDGSSTSTCPWGSRHWR
jgi:MFS family permease